MVSRQRAALFLHALVERTARRKRGWSDAPGVPSLHSDWMVVAANIYLHLKLHHAPGQEEPDTLADFVDAFGELIGASHT